jgi:hypothetical protein
VWRSRDTLYLAPRADDSLSRRPAKVLSLIAVAQSRIVRGLIVMRNVRARTTIVARRQRQR